jgi:hypothetical protein
LRTRGSRALNFSYFFTSRATEYHASTKAFRNWRDPCFYAPAVCKWFHRRKGEAIARSNVRLATIHALLERNPICLEIVRYFSRHTEAADTARGIADWWIQRDVPSTATALVQLERCGIVRSYPVQDTTSVYAYTKNPLVRRALKHYVAAASRTPTGTA